MAVGFVRLPETSPGLVADRRLYETADGLPVEDGDTRAAFLVVGGPGQVIDRQTAHRLGLWLDDGRVTWGPPTPPREPEPAPLPEPEPEPQENEEEVGFALEARPGGWYVVIGPDGVVKDESGADRKVKGKQAAQELLAAIEAAFTQPETEP